MAVPPATGCFGGNSNRPKTPTVNRGAVLMVDFAPPRYPHNIKFETTMNSTVLATLTAHSALSFLFGAAILTGATLIAREIIRSLSSTSGAARARRLREARALAARGAEVIFLTHR